MFEDTSIYNGWIEFESPIGEIRAKHQGSGSYNIYTKQDDTFILRAMIGINGKATPRNIYDRMLLMQPVANWIGKINDLDLHR